MCAWIDQLTADPIPWLIDEATPAVRHPALHQLLDRDPDGPDVGAAGAAAKLTDPIASIPAAQDAECSWIKPGNGYGHRYREATWQLIFLDQLGADRGYTPELEG